MDWIRKATAWTKRNALALVGGLLAVLGALFWWSRNRDRVESFWDALIVERSRREIAVLEERRRALTESADARAEEVKAVEAKILENKRAAVSVRHEAQVMSDAEVLVAFDRLGYLLPLVFWIATAAMTSIAGAQAPHVAPCAPEVMQRRAALTHDGQPGVWFHEAVARCMLADLQELGFLRERLVLFEQDQSLRNAQIGDLRAALAASRGISDAAEEAITASSRRAERAEEARDAWYRQPVLWFVLGAAASVLLGGIVVAAVAF
jgi:hypothetical protein